MIKKYNKHDKNQKFLKLIDQTLTFSSHVQNIQNENKINDDFNENYDEAKENQTWSCNMCTFINSINDKRCTMCGCSGVALKVNNMSNFIVLYI